MKMSFFLPAMLVASHCLAADYPAVDRTHANSALDLSSYKVSWSDEFDSFKAAVPGQAAGIWYAGVHAILATGEKLATASDPAFEDSSGILNMSTRLDQTDNLRVEAHLQTDDGKGHSVTFQDGYAEARLWLPKALGSHAGFWLLSKETGSGHAEVDVVESYGAGDYATHSSTHIWPIPPATHQYVSKRIAEPDIYDGYHLYGLLATESQFIFYYDRKELARVQRLPQQRVPFYMLLSVFGNTSQPVIAEPATMLVDYVRVYSPTTPNPPKQVVVQ